MRILRGILAVSGHLAGRRAPANNVHLALFSRALQILAQQEPVRLQKLSAPDSGPSLARFSCQIFFFFAFLFWGLWFITAAMIGLRDRGDEAGAAGGQERHREGDAPGVAERDREGEG